MAKKVERTRNAGTITEEEFMLLIHSMSGKNIHWKDVVGYEGLYKVSSNGDIVSLLRGGTIMSPKIDKDGYLLINLWKNGSQKTHRIHRLVALAFLKKKEGKNAINHIDEEKSNNNCNNLEWCNNYENINHGSAIARISKKLSKEVEQIDNHGVIIKIWTSATEASRSGYSQSAISKCCRENKGKHKGYTWRFSEKNKKQ